MKEIQKILWLDETASFFWICTRFVCAAVNKLSLSIICVLHESFFSNLCDAKRSSCNTFNRWWCIVGSHVIWSVCWNDDIWRFASVLILLVIFGLLYKAAIRCDNILARKYKNKWMILHLHYIQYTLSIRLVRWVGWVWIDGSQGY